MSGPARRSAWIAVAAALAAVGGVFAVVFSLWGEVGDSSISPAGWLAMILGVLATLTLGIGLMSLVFISSRHGYDDDGGDHR